MKVHPAPKKRNISLQHDVASPNRQKKLRRLPHLFAKVLELPFRSDADVSIEETDEFLRFTVSDTDIASDVRADTVEIYPGVTKVVIRSAEMSREEFGLDSWRFRLPSSSRPQLAIARYSDGDLVVTVPKVEDGENREEEVWDEGNLVLVQ